MSPMSTESYDSMNQYEKAVLSSAWDASYLIEFRNGIVEYTANGLNLPDAGDIETYRHRIGTALVSLVNRGLVTVWLCPWEDDSHTTPMPIETLEAMLADGSAWDSERDLLINLGTPDT
jgi:hypothetical protein